MRKQWCKLIWKVIQVAQIIHIQIAQIHVGHVVAAHIATHAAAHAATHVVTHVVTHAVTHVVTHAVAHAIAHAISHGIAHVVSHIQTIKVVNIICTVYVGPLIGVEQILILKAKVNASRRQTPNGLALGRIWWPQRLDLAGRVGHRSIEHLAVIQIRWHVVLLLLLLLRLRHELVVRLLLEIGLHQIRSSCRRFGRIEWIRLVPLR